MTQENKDLLLRDLSARLPYKVKCVSGVDDAILIIEGINPNCNGASEVQVTYERSGINFDTKISSIKPFLFPLSSMTSEQKREYVHIVAKCSTIASPQLAGMTIQDWFDKNHFDYRGLIPMGLANDATGLNIY